MSDAIGDDMKGWTYRAVMKIAHKYNWHYAPPIYPEGDTQLWCTWCGFRQTIHKCGQDGLTKIFQDEEQSQVELSNR